MTGVCSRKPCFLSDGVRTDMLPPSCAPGRSCPLPRAPPARKYEREPSFHGKGIWAVLVAGNACGECSASRCASPQVCVVELS